MDTFVLKQDLYRFYRHIRLKAFYSSKPVVSNVSLPPLSISNLGLKNKGGFVPPTSCAAAELFINKVDEDINQFLHTYDNRDHIPKNMTQEEILALSSLAARKEITIKPADKGGSIVIMNTIQYEREIHRQLADPQVYKCLEVKSTTRVLNRIKKVVGQAVQNNIIDVNTQTYFI